MLEQEIFRPGMMTDDSDLIDLVDARLREFVRLCIAWDAVPLTNAAEANAVSDRIWHLGEELREWSEARVALEDYAASHPSAAVRLKAAVTSLGWAPTIGISSLEEIAAGRGSQYGMLPSLAIALLSSFRAKTLFP